LSPGCVNLPHPQTLAAYSAGTSTSLERAMEGGLYRVQWRGDANDAWQTLAAPNGSSPEATSLGLNWMGSSSSRWRPANGLFWMGFRRMRALVCGWSMSESHRHLHADSMRNRYGALHRLYWRTSAAQWYAGWPASRYRVLCTLRTRGNE
jgi:hypothetical protein